MFSSKGAQDHMVSNMWKDTIKRERTIEKQWNMLYNKKKYEQAQNTAKELVELQKEHDTDRQFGAGRVKSEQQQLNLSRQELLKNHQAKREEVEKKRDQTSSGDVGRRSADRYNPVLLAERANPTQAHPRHPVMMTSFFRTGGVNI